MYKSFTTLMALGMAAAAPSRMMTMPRQEAPRKLIIGAPGQIITADFDGSVFSKTSTFTQEGTAPSWMLYREPNLVYAVNENADELNLFALDGNRANPVLQGTSSGTSGVVSLEYNGEKTRLVGASYGTGSYDVWDIQPDNSLKFFKNVKLQGGTIGPGQTQHRAHQALLDPSGRYLAIPDLGADVIAIVDTEHDSYEVVNTVDVGAGTGPRHGGFISINGGSQASHYVVATELSNELHLFKLSYREGNIDFAPQPKVSTYGEAFPPKNATSAAAGELIVANDGHIYVSNRISGNETDSIAHFRLEANAAGESELVFVDTVSSGGLIPRMFSLSKDPEQSFAFVGNQGGDSGVAIFKRDAATGSLDPTPVATVPLSEFGSAPNPGPQFIQEI